MGCGDGVSPPKGITIALDNNDLISDPRWHEDTSEGRKLDEREHLQEAKELASCPPSIPECSGDHSDYGTKPQSIVQVCGSHRSGKVPSVRQQCRTGMIVLAFSSGFTFFPMSCYPQRSFRGCCIFIHHQQPTLVDERQLSVLGNERQPALLNTKWHTA